MCLGKCFGKGVLLCGVWLVGGYSLLERIGIFCFLWLCVVIGLCEEVYSFGGVFLGNG